MILEQEIFTIIFEAIDCGAENGDASKAWLTIYPHGVDQVLSSWLTDGHELRRLYIPKCIEIITKAPRELTLTSPCRVIREYEHELKGDQ